RAAGGNGERGDVPGVGPRVLRHGGRGGRRRRPHGPDRVADAYSRAIGGDLMPRPTLDRRQFLFGSAAVLSASLAGPARARAQAPGGEIIAGLAERMLTLDPANHYSVSATSVLRHVYDPLLDVTNDDRFVPALAESWRAVNNTTWKFTLRKGVSFHDGSPF